MNYVLAHLVGDFLIQNDWMAKGKKTSNWICLLHAVTYTIPFWFCGLLWWQIGAIMVQHFYQDRWNFVGWFMKVTGKREDGFLGPPMAPWSIIVTDNILHLLWIAFVVWLPESGIASFLKAGFGFAMYSFQW